MQVNNNVNPAYGYGMSTESPLSVASHTDSSAQRENFGSALVGRLDDRGYQAFINATKDFTLPDKVLAAKTLDKTAAVSAANQYAMTHGVTMTQDLAVVYTFFENYQDVVSSEQIKHLLNTRLQLDASVEGKKFESQQFFEDMTAQLGGHRALDVRV